MVRFIVLYDNIYSTNSDDTDNISLNRWLSHVIHTVGFVQPNEVNYSLIFFAVVAVAHTYIIFFLRVTCTSLIIGQRCLWVSVVCKCSMLLLLVCFSLNMFDTWSVSFCVWCVSWLYASIALVFLHFVFTIFFFICYILFRPEVKTKTDREVHTREEWKQKKNHTKRPRVCEKRTHVVNVQKANEMDVHVCFVQSFVFWWDFKIWNIMSVRFLSITQLHSFLLARVCIHSHTEHMLDNCVSLFGCFLFMLSSSTKPNKLRISPIEC